MGMTRCLLVLLIGVVCVGCSRAQPDREAAREVANAFFLAIREKLYPQARGFLSPNNPWAEMSLGQFETFARAAEDIGALDYTFTLEQSESDNPRAGLFVFTVVRRWKDSEVLGRAARSSIQLNETFFAQARLDCALELRDGRWKIASILPTREITIFQN